jgi:hypothetical protein
METLEKKPTSMNVVKANKDDYSKTEELVERYPVKNTPFTIITIEDENFGVMGEYRITESYKSRGECEDALVPFTWNRMIQVVMILEEIRKKDKDFDKKVRNKLNNKK